MVSTTLVRPATLVPVSVEIERKFLVTRLPDGIDTAAARPLRQGYLAEDGSVAVRVRIDGGHAVLTVKAGRGLTRTEVEVGLSAEQAAALWPHTAGRSLEKRRLAVPLAGEHAGLIVDLDLYDGALVGLMTAEVEFPDESTARAFTPPSWFDRELTGEPGWSNADLARDGIPGR